MSCAFNVMSVYFYSMHASKNKTTPRHHMNNKKHVRCKSDRPPKARRETFVPKPKQKVVKAVYRVKCPVIEKAKVIKAVYRVKSTVNDIAMTAKLTVVAKPDKGQFFKDSGPKQLWVPKIT